MDIGLTDLRPAEPAKSLDWDSAQHIPEEIVARFEGKRHPARSIGHAVRRKYGSGKYAVRVDDDGHYWLVPLK